MRIGVIGSGKVGGTLGKHWAKAGHKVLLSSRNPQKLRSLVKEAGKNAKAVCIAEAFEADADVYLLATPFKAIDRLSELYAGECTDKIIIDATNPYPKKDGYIAQKVSDADHSATEYTATKFSTAMTTKAFNTINAEFIRDKAFKETNKLAIPFAAQNHRSREITKKLIEDIGFDSFYTGVLNASDLMDPGQELYNNPMNLAELRDALYDIRIGQTL